MISKILLSLLHTTGVNILFQKYFLKNKSKKTINHKIKKIVINHFLNFFSVNLYLALCSLKDAEKTVNFLFKCYDQEARAISWS